MRSEPESNPIFWKSESKCLIRVSSKRSKGQPSVSNFLLFLGHFSNIEGSLHLIIGFAKKRFCVCFNQSNVL